MKRILSIIITTFSILSIGFEASAWERCFDFEKDKIGNPADGLVVDGSADNRPLFIVQKDGKEKNQILALNGSTFGLYSAPLFALAWFSELKNGSLSVDFLHSGNERTVRKAGLTWRYQPTGEAYIWECDTVKSVVRLIKLVDGKKKVLEDKRVKAPPLEWLHISVDFKDDVIQCNFAGQKIFEVKDSQINESGKVGIYLDSDIPVLF
jgi:hypothetical protein